MHELAPDVDAFWTRPLQRQWDELRSSERGLGEAAARSLRAIHGDNVLRVERRRALAVEYLSHFRNPLVLLLLAASAASALLGDVTSFVVIGLIVLGSVTLDFVQEHRAATAATRLRESVAVRATVLRDGAPARLPAAQLVPGDVVRLAAGDLVPADGRVVEARDFFVRQSALTGESFPVEKRAGDLEAGATTLVDATNAAFMGSSVLSGSATLLVCRTGPSTFLGGIADTLREPAGPTAFERGTRGFGLLVLRMTTALVLFIAFVHLLANRPVQETFMFAVALAVGLTPELLPMIVSVTLSRGALRMAARKVVVKRLAAIQNMGSMDVLCTDKTGTLTEAAIRLERCVDAQGRDSRRVRELAYLNSSLESGLRSPLDDAILACRDVDAAGWSKLDEVPFGFERRRVSVLAERGGERLLVVKGAPEDMLRICDRLEDGASPEGAVAATPMDDGARARCLERFEALSRDGFRVLAVAWRAVPPDHAHAVVDDESQLVLCGFAIFLDPPKASAAAALERLRRSHVRVKVLTGDNEWVTRHVCAQVGLPVKHLLTGAQIDQLDDGSLAVQAQRADAFCRVSPPQKSRILRALRRRGHVVGFLGDGVNDAPSLHEADVGISVDSAVDVARDAADMILLEHDLGVLHDGVIEGRRTFANVMKYIMMGTSSNFGNMFSMAGASLILPFLPMLPVQILLNNLLYDVSEVPIPLDDVDPDYAQRPHDWDPGFIRRFMLTLGPVSSLFDFATFWLLVSVFHARAELFRTGWFIESIATQVLVIFVIRTRGAPWRSRPASWLVAAAVTVVLLAVVLPFTPAAGLLGFVAPPAALLAVIALLTLVYLGCAELAKRWFYRRGARSRRRVPAAMRGTASASRAPARRGHQPTAW
ncbi:MAG: magnesium-translocating P-type ATPase [Burkholderiaceae bacterium]